MPGDESKQWRAASPSLWEKRPTLTHRYVVNGGRLRAKVQHGFELPWIRLRVTNKSAVLIQFLFPFLYRPPDAPREPVSCQGLFAGSATHHRPLDPTFRLRFLRIVF